MKTTRVLSPALVFLSLPLTGLLAGPSLPLPTSKTLTVPPADFQPHFQVQEFYHNYLLTLNLVDPSIIFRHSIGDSAGIDALLKDMECEARFVREKKLDTPSALAEFDQAALDQLALDQLAIPLLFRYWLKFRSYPPDDYLLKAIQSYPDRFPTEEFVFGWEILVESDEGTSGTETGKTLAWIEKKLQSEQFQWVAVQYYQRVGVEYDGSLGRVHRGQIPDWKFDAFLKAPDTGPWFGPVRVPKGYLFGKIQSRLAAGGDLLAAYRERALMWMLQERYYREIGVFEEARTKDLNLEVYPYDHASSLGVQQIAYRIKDYTPRFQEILTRFPHIQGDPKDPRFYDAMARHGIKADLINFSPEAEAIRRTPAYKYIIDSHKTAWLVDRYVKERLGQIDVTQDKLRQFYDEHGAELFAKPDLVRLLVISRKRDNAVDRDPIRRSDPRKPEFVAVQRLRSEFLQSPTLETARRLAAADPAVEVKVDEKPVAEDTLGRVLESGVYQVPEGEVTPVLVGPHDYAFAKVLSREKRPLEKFEDLADQVRFEFLLSRKRRLLSEIYPADRVKTFY